MKLGKIYTFENASEAKNLIGKRVIACDCLAEVASECLESVVNHIPNYKRCILNRIEEDEFYPFCVKDSNERFQFIREVIDEEEEPLMANRQLAEWLAKGNGQMVLVNEKEQIDSLDFIYTHYNFREREGREFVGQNTRIRSWDSNEWVMPTINIYERDCKKRNPWE